MSRRRYFPRYSPRFWSPRSSSPAPFFLPSRHSWRAVDLCAERRTVHVSVVGDCGAFLPGEGVFCIVSLGGSLCLACFRWLPRQGLPDLSQCYIISHRVGGYYRNLIYAIWVKQKLR